MKPVKALEWFKKHKGHEIIVTPVKVKGLPAGAKMKPLKDYKCMDCKSGLITSVEMPKSIFQKLMGVFCGRG